MFIRSLIGAFVLSTSALFFSFAVTNEYMELVSSEPHASRWAAQGVHKPRALAVACESAPLAVGAEVRGFVEEIPGLTAAKRMTFSGHDAVTYVIRANIDEVVVFYAAAMPQYCWRQAVDGGLVFKKEGEASAVRISASKIPDSSKVAVTYERGGVVLGESTVRAAQDFNSGSFIPPPSGSTGQFMPSSNGSQPYGDQGKMMPPPPLGNGQYGMQPEGTIPSQGGFMPPQNNQMMPSQNSMMPKNEGQFMGKPGEFMPPQGLSGQGMNPPNQNQGFAPGGMRGTPQGQGMMRGEGVDGGQMEKQQEKMDAQRFAMMKQGVVQFAKQTSMMKKRMSQVEAKLKKSCNMSLPVDLKNALEASSAVAAKIEAAQDADQLDEVIVDVEDISERLREGGQEIPELFGACELMRRIDKDVKQVETLFARTHKKALASKDEGIIGLSKQAEVGITEAKTMKDGAKTLSATDPIEAASQMEGVYEKLGEVKVDIEGVEAALNIKKNITKIGNDLKRYETTIARLEKQKKDVTTARDLLAQAKQTYEELKAALQAGDKDQMYELVQTLYDLKQQLDEEIQKLSGGSYVPKVNVQEKGFDFAVPEGFERQMGGTMMEAGGAGTAGGQGQTTATP